VAFTGMDIGGFTGNPSTNLYIRWMELGAFIPYYRNHTALNSKAAEPWTFGEDALDIVRNYVSLRYEMLPYIYSTFYKATQSGMPVMRSLAIDYTFDPKVLDAAYQNQFEFGDAFMVAPFESTKDYGKIYFPQGTWYELYTGAKEVGGSTKTVDLNINKLPVYVKGGSIIPMQSLTQSTNEQPTDTLTVHIYNGNNASSFVYYEDDGKSFDYKKGSFYKRIISLNPQNQTITFDNTEGTYKSHFKSIKVILHGFEQTAAIKLNGEMLKLQQVNFAFLGAAAGTDPQGSAYQTESCPVKFFVIHNDEGKIQLNY
jgi:alpha-glucosidase